MLQRVISPLPYTSYHMTTYIIYKNSQSPIAFVQDWLNEDPTRTVSQEKCIPNDDVYPIMQKAQRIWDKTGKEYFTVKTEFINANSVVLCILVSMEDAERRKKFSNAILESNHVFGRSLGRTSRTQLHITLGYIYSEIDNLTAEEEDEFERELSTLKQIIPKTFTMEPPAVMSHSSMSEFVPIVKK